MCEQVLGDVGVLYCTWAIIFDLLHMQNLHFKVDFLEIDHILLRGHVGDTRPDLSKVGNRVECHPWGSGVGAPDGAPW